MLRRMARRRERKQYEIAGVQEVAALLGDISKQAIADRMGSQSSPFPEPDLIIGGRRLWQLETIVNYCNARGETVWYELYDARLQANLEAYERAQQDKRDR